MDVQADKVIAYYAQELARVQQQLFITQAALDAYQEKETTQTIPVETDN